MDMTVRGDYTAATQEMRHRLESKQRELSVKNTLRAAQKKKKSKKKCKKKLSYNSREIALQLTQVNHSIGAGQVLIRAAGKLAQLQRCAATGDYDAGEMRAAIAHATKMVKCARLKKIHLREEESVALQKKKNNKTNDIEKELEIQRLLHEELKKLRRKHRGEENGEIEKAQMSYSLRQRAMEIRSEIRMSEMAEMQTGITVDVTSAATDVTVDGAAAAEVGGAVDVCM